MIKQPIECRFVVCLRNDECEDIERGKLYRVIADRRAARDGYLRIVDESGEDYLYPEAYFSAVRLPVAAEEALAGVR